MIFIAGLSPKTKVLDQNPRRCPVCGLQQAYFKRVDHYLSLFFIPVLRVKKGAPFLMCGRCQGAFSEFGQEVSPSQGETGLRCRFCGKSIRQTFSYCPHCGKKI
jgi:rubrerythrin